MASFPEITLGESDFKVRFREEFASEVLNQRFMGLPFGVYFGFDPLVAGDNVSLKIDAALAVSILRAMSTISKTSLDVFFEADISLNFTGHDFVASGDLYVIATVSYVRNGTTTARIFTSTSPASGTDSIGICRLAGTAAPGVITAFAAAIPDKHSPLAKGGSPNAFGFMPAGAVEDVENLLAQIGKHEINPTIQTCDVNPLADGKINLVDYSAAAGSYDINLPDSSLLPAGITGCIVRVLLTENILGAFNHFFKTQGTDLLKLGTGLGTASATPKHRGGYVEFTLTREVSPAVWHITATDNSREWYQALGREQIPLDTLAIPSDNTDLDASISRHGLLRKLSGVPTEFLNGSGIFAVPGGATSGANHYLYNGPIVTAPGPFAVTPGGGIHRFSGAGGPASYLFPAAAGELDGVVVRIQIEFPVPGVLLTFDASAGPDLIGWPNTPQAPTIAFNAATRSLLEFTLDKTATSGPTWKLTAFSRDPQHEVSHYAVGGDDVLDVKLLGGYPGGATTFLRDDGTFAVPVQPNIYFQARMTTNVTNDVKFLVLNVGETGGWIVGNAVSGGSVGAGTGVIRGYHPARRLLAVDPDGGSDFLAGDVAVSGGSSGTIGVANFYPFGGVGSSRYSYTSNIETLGGFVTSPLTGLIEVPVAGTYLISVHARYINSTVFYVWIGDRYSSLIVSNAVGAAQCVNGYFNDMTVVVLGRDMIAGDVIGVSEATFAGASGLAAAIPGPEATISIVKVG
jgi:hypothetical protein